MTEIEIAKDYPYKSSTCTTSSNTQQILYLVCHIGAQILLQTFAKKKKIQTNKRSWVNKKA